MADVLVSESEAFHVKPGPGRAGLAAVLDEPGWALLALDFDGTLSPITDRPEDAAILPAAAEALDRLGRRLGTVAIITGRPAKVAVALGGLADLPGLSTMIVLGQYGAERWDAATGNFQIPPPPLQMDRVEQRVRQLISDLELPGIGVENKQRALGVHTRLAPDPAAAFDILLEPVTRIAEEHGFDVEPGKAVLEIRPPGQDKGMALASLIAERSARSVIFAGDDLGDLAAYDEVDRQRARGVPGLLVASASAEQDALTARADVVRYGPEEIAQWLAQLADVLDVGAATAG